MQRNNGAGKRPLFISGSQRQMLHDIKESLLHATQLQQQPQIAATDAGQGEGMQIKGEIGQSSLQDKMSSGPAAGGSGLASNPRDAGYNKQAMAKIRQSLEGFQASKSVSKPALQAKQSFEVGYKE